MKRRTFLKQSITLSAGFMAMPSIAWETRRLVGLQLYTLRDVVKDDVAGTFKKIAAAGYGELEMFGLAKDNTFFGLPVSKVATLLKENNLLSPSGHYMPEDFLFKNGNGDDVKNLCDVGHQLKNDYIIIPSLSPDHRKNINQYKVLAEKLNKAGEIVKAAGLQLAYHNHDFEFADFGGQSGYDILLKDTDANLLKMEMDIYWVVRAGYDPLKLFKEHPGRFHLWHVKDMDKKDPSKNTEICNGSIDFKKIFKAAKLAGAKHFIMEQENNYKPDYFGSIESSSKAVEKLFKKI